MPQTKFRGETTQKVGLHTPLERLCLVRNVNVFWVQLFNEYPSILLWKDCLFYTVIDRYLYWVGHNTSPCQSIP